MALSMTSSSSWTLPELKEDRFELFEAGVRTTLMVRCPLAITFLDGTNKPPSKDELAERFDVDGRLGLFMTGGSIAGDTAKPFPMSSKDFGKSSVSAVITTSGAVVETYTPKRIQAIIDYATAQADRDDPSGGAGGLPSLAEVGKGSAKAAGTAKSGITDRSQKRQEMQKQAQVANYARRLLHAQLDAQHEQRCAEYNTIDPLLLQLLLRSAGSVASEIVSSGITRGVDAWTYLVKKTGAAANTPGAVVGKLTQLLTTPLPAGGDFAKLVESQQPSWGPLTASTLVKKMNARELLSLLRLTATSLSYR